MLTGALLPGPGNAEPGIGVDPWRVHEIERMDLENNLNWLNDVFLDFLRVGKKIDDH